MTNVSVSSDKVTVTVTVALPFLSNRVTNRSFPSGLTEAVACTVVLAGA